MNQFLSTREDKKFLKFLLYNYLISGFVDLSCFHGFRHKSVVLINNFIDLANDLLLYSK